MSRRAPGRGTRRGVGALVPALVFLLFLAGIGVLMRMLSRQAAGDVHRSQLAGLARLQAQAAVHELRAELAREANRPGTDVFRLVREKMDEPFGRLDLGPVLDDPQEKLVPRFGVKTTGAAGEGLGVTLDTWASLTETRAFRDVGGSEEWAGLVTLGARAEALDGSGKLRRDLEAAYELRTLLIAPPRPFDQITLYLGHVDAAVDVVRAKSIRDQAIRGAVALKAELGALPTGLLADDDKRWLAEIVAAMHPADVLEARIPALPDGDACLFGFRHVNRYWLDDLDFMAGFEKFQAKIEAARAAYDAIAVLDHTKIKAAYDLVDAYATLHDALWQANWVTTVLDKTGEAYKKSFEPYLARLEAEHFLDRVTWRPTPDDPVFKRWKAGSTRLDGVIDARASPDRLELAGEIQGRVILLVGPRGLRLKDAGWASSRAGSRLVVVSLGGEVMVEGESAASVLMLAPPGGGAPGRLTVPAGATLRGSVIAPHATRGSNSLAGILEADPGLRTPYPPSKTLESGTRGEYLVVVSPQPLFMKEAAVP